MLESAEPLSIAPPGNPRTGAGCESWRCHWRGVALNKGCALSRCRGPARFKQRLHRLPCRQAWTCCSGNGSDELIQIILMGVAKSGRRGAGANADLRDVRNDRYVRRHEVRRRAAQRLWARSAGHARGDQAASAGGGVSVLPEQPDRQSVRRAAIETRCASAPDGLVVVDEAYHAFAAETFMDRSGNSTTCW